MGREFLDVFTGWAESYDSFVQGHDPEYKEAFRRYDEILNEIVNRSGNSVLEFGIGTGNLTKLLLDKGKTVFPIEPSPEMRIIASKKLGENITIHDGDLIEFPKPQAGIDTIVSSYVFHHLTDQEKYEAIKIYSSLLNSKGKIVFADTMFLTENDYKNEITKAENANYINLRDDLIREYYPLIPVIRSHFEKNGFDVKFEQYNDFVWIVEATKK
ncbi:SAM-dependent methyltransferase [Bacillus sp. AFS001701]|uniref:class I SAM-dependent DNA methyltransferase n=1 Tax=Bacillus sp. AFS001701 TaxID=2033480 RepID=UPI000BF95874|nr:class I SAM-dependent methyltransferase [Bacillus sp. AFS001701]PET43550.1 SAM-dependent methyltransferase [Bacillus sp. AFS001701]